MKKGNLALLLLVPITILIFNLMMVRNQRSFYFNWDDPAYAYLLNGLNIAHGKMEVGHIDHPGTTIQTANGIIIRMVYTFSGKEKDMSTDLLADPEKYLHIISFIFILINCVLLFYAGFKVYKIGGNIATALFFQSGILVFFNTLATLANPAPETFLAWGTLLLTLTCFTFIHDHEILSGNPGKKMFRYAIKFGLICAFLAVTKITSLPLLILPFFMLPKWKSKLVYVFSFLVFGFIFLIPALSKIVYFFAWANRLFFHSGIYGAGEEKIVDPNAFRQGLYYIFTADILFGIILGLMLVTLVILIFSGRLTFQKWKADPSLRLLAGLFLTALFCMAIVAKHFSYHYLVPGYCLMTLGAIVSFRHIFSPVGRIAVLFSKPWIATTVVLCFIGAYTINNYSQYYFFKDYHNPKIETAEFMEKYKDIPRLYVTWEHPGTEVSPALYFGLSYSGMMKYNYIPILEKIYPLSNFYSYPENKFHAWKDDNLDWPSMVEKNQQMLISFYNENEAVINGTFNVLNQINEKSPVIEIRKLYRNPETDEQIYLMTRIGKVDLTRDTSGVIACDAEKFLGSNLLSNDTKYTFQGLECQTDKYAHSGKKSIELNSKTPYGFGFHLPIKKEKHYEVTVWRKSESGKGVVSAVGPDYSSPSSTVVEQGPDGWSKISLKFQVPASYTDSAIQIFVWNEGSELPCYFDDITIMEY